MNSRFLHTISSPLIYLALLTLTVSCGESTFDESEPELPPGYVLPEGDMGKYITNSTVSFKVDKLELQGEMAYLRLSASIADFGKIAGYTIASTSYKIDGKDVIPMYTDGITVNLFDHYDKGEHTAAATIILNYNGKNVKTVSAEQKFTISGMGAVKQDIDACIDIIENYEGYPFKARLFVNEQRSNPDYGIGKVTWALNSENTFVTDEPPYIYIVQQPGEPNKDSYLSALLDFSSKGDASNHRYNLISNFGTIPNSRDSKFPVKLGLLSHYFVYEKAHDIVGIARVYSPSASNFSLSIKIDGEEYTTITEFPYELRFPASDFAPGLHTIIGTFTRSDIPSSEGNSLVYLLQPFVVLE